MPVIDPPAELGSVYCKIAYGPLFDVFVLDVRSYRGPNGEENEATYGPTAYFLGHSRSPAQARIAQFARDLEGDRG